MNLASLITLFILVRALWCVEKFFINDDEMYCIGLEQTPSNIIELVQELDLDESVRWKHIGIENKNFSKLNKYIFENMTIEGLYLRRDNIEVIEDGAFDRITDLKFLGLDNNKLAEFRSSAMLTSLVSLDLSGNNLRLLDVDSFSRLKNIETISLTDNSIERIVPGVFDLPSLETLNLIGNNIKECSNKTFANFPQLATLWFDSNNLETVQFACFNGLDSLKELSITNNILRDSVSMFSSLRLVNNLDAAGNLLTEISANLLKGLTNVTILNLNDNFIKTIHQDAFKDLKNAKELYLNRNLIQNVTSNMFMGAAGLEEILLNQNKLKQIEIDAFAGLEGCLTSLELTNNRLEYLKGHYFKRLKKLNYLNLADNLISFIEVTTFRDLISLEYLDLSQNAIFSIDKGVFNNLQSLSTLYLKQNCLKSVRIFTNLTSLYTLNVSSNHITQLDLAYLNKNSPNLNKLLISDNIFDNPTLYVSEIGISLLDVSQTNLEVIKIDRTMSKLSSLNISNNPFLQSIEGLEYTGMKKLYIRNISLGLLTSIDLNRFIPQLTELDLSYNDLDDVDISFHDMPFMQKLRLSNSFENKMLEMLTYHDNLTELDLSGNSLSNVSLGRLSDIQKLNLAYNNLTGLNELGSTESLEILDLSFNKLKVIKKKWFDEFNLVELYLSHNMIETIERRSFNMSKLKVLDLKNNRIKHFSNVNFDQGLIYTVGLKSLSISYNDLGSIDLAGFGRFVYFDASYNHLTKIYNFRDVSSETYILDVSCNNFTRIVRSYLSKAVLLLSLNFSHNQISHVESNSFAELNALEVLDLSHNQLTGLNEELFDSFSALYFLDLSHNQLESIQKRLFKVMISIEYLDLSSNQIKYIEDLCFQDAQRLFKLSLDSNSYSLRFSDKTFTGLESISFITISPEYFDSMDNIIIMIDSLMSNGGRYVGSRSYSSEYKIEYYRSISLNYPELPSHYSLIECLTIMILLNNEIQLNLNTKEDVDMFVSECSSHLNFKFLKE